MELKGSETEKNLLKAFAGESQARMRYTYFASVAKKEGFEQPEEKANQMRAVLEKYPHWRKSENHEREVKRELYAVLVRSEMKDTRKVTESAKSIMRVLKGATA